MTRPARECGSLARQTEGIAHVNVNALSFVAACAGILAACGAPSPPGTLRADLAALRTQGAGAVLDLGSSIPAEWDTVLVLNPYASPAAIDSALGFTWRGAEERAIGHDDAYNLLVFRQRGRVRYAELIERTAGDFCCVEGTARYARTDARFTPEIEGTAMRLRHIATR